MSMIEQMVESGMHTGMITAFRGCSDEAFLSWCHEARKGLLNGVDVGVLTPFSLLVPETLATRLFATAAGFVAGSIVLGGGVNRVLPKPLEVDVTMSSPSTVPRSVTVNFKERSGEPSE